MEEIIYFLCGLLILFLLNIPFLAWVHEAGHLFFGSITGYRLLVFRIGRFALVKAEKRYRMAYVQKPDSFAQCILYPKHADRSLNPKWQLAGGILLNSLFGIFFIACCVLTEEFILFVAFVTTGLLNFLCAVCNACSRNEASDGKSMQFMQDEQDQKYYNSQLLIAEGLVSGKCYSEMDEDLFYRGYITAQSSIYEKELAIYSYYRLLEAGSFHGAKQLLSDLDVFCRGGWLKREIHREKHFLYNLLSSDYVSMHMISFTPNDMRLNQEMIDKKAMKRFRHYIYPGEIKSAITILSHVETL